MSAITGWRFECPGVVIDESTQFTPDIIQLTEDLNIPQNQLGYAKVMIMQLGFPNAIFKWEGFSIEIPTNKITTFNPFIRTAASGSGSSAAGGGEALYLLDGQEYPFVKKNQTFRVSI